MRKKFLLLIFILGLFSFAGNAQAGFGISPPYVKSKNPIFPGSHYEQRITLLRSSAENDLQAQIVINAPEIDKWITIDKGNVFDLPTGSLQVPMVVNVDVPASAQIGDYKGYINIQIVPKGSEGGGVSIALGARVDIDLSVTNEKLLDFLVRKSEIPDFERLKQPWSWKIFSYFFYRLKVGMTIENTGNSKAAPTRVHIDVSDLTQSTVLESHDTKSLKQIDPFKTDTIYASFPTDLPVGQYWGDVSVYKDNEIIHKNKLAFTVAAPGALGKGLGYGIWPYAEMGALILLILLFVWALVKLKFWKYILKALIIISWPLRFLIGKTGKFWTGLKLKFWRWMHNKSSKYQDYGQRTDTIPEERRPIRRQLVPGPDDETAQTPAVKPVRTVRRRVAKKVVDLGEIRGSDADDSEE